MCGRYVSIKSDGDVLRDKASHRMANNRCLRDFHLVHERNHVRGKLLHGVTTHGLSGLSMSALIENVDAILAVE